LLSRAELEKAGGGYSGVGGCAKRLKCVELAPAFESPTTNESASKLDALHTLREVRLRLCGCAALRGIADFQSAGLGMSRSRGKSGSPAGWEPCDTADWKSIGNLRYIDLFDKAEMRPSLSRRQNRA